MLPANATASLLVAQPFENRVALIAHIATEAHVWDEPASRVLAHPAYGDGEHLGDLVGVEEPFTHRPTRSRALFRVGEVNITVAPRRRSRNSRWMRPTALMVLRRCS